MIQLSDRQKQIYNLAIQGKCNKEIAVECNVVLQTVKFHMTNILRKYGVKRRTQLVAASLTAKSAPNLDTQLLTTSSDTL